MQFSHTMTAQVRGSIHRLARELTLASALRTRWPGSAWSGAPWYAAACARSLPLSAQASLCAISLSTGRRARGGGPPAALPLQPASAMPSSAVHSAAPGAPVLCRPTCEWRLPISSASTPTSAASRARSWCRGPSQARAMPLTQPAGRASRARAGLMPCCSRSALPSVSRPADGSGAGKPQPGGGRLHARRTYSACTFTYRTHPHCTQNRAPNSLDAGMQTEAVLVETYEPGRRRAGAPLPLASRPDEQHC